MVGLLLDRATPPGGRRETDMSAPADKVARVPSGPVLPFTSPTLVRFASIAFCGVLPALVLISVFAAAVGDDSVAFDFRLFLSAAHAVLHGESPYPSLAASDEVIGRSYVYPPLTALVSVPFTVLSRASCRADRHGSARGGCARGSLGPRRARLALLRRAAAVAARDLGNPDRQRHALDRAPRRGRMAVPRPLALASSTAIGVTLAAKFFLWPLVVWLAATRRVAAPYPLCAIGAGLLLVSWAAIGFAGLAGLPGTPAAAARTRWALTRIPRTSWDSISACPQRSLARVWLGRRARVARRVVALGTARRRADRLHRRDRGVARAHSDRVAPLLRPSARRRRACAAVGSGSSGSFRSGWSSRRGAVIRRRSRPLDVGRRSRHRRARAVPRRVARAARARVLVSRPRVSSSTRPRWRT